MNLSAIRQKCWGKAVHAYGTGYIFEERARTLGKKIRLLAFLGIAVPTSMGGIVLAFGTDFEYKSVVLIVAGVIGIIQLIASVWALVADWQDAYAYAHESMAANYRLAENFESLASNPPSAPSEVEANFSALMAEDKVLSQRDYRQEITPEEKRKGMRAALRKYQRECAFCGKVPKSMSPSECDVCGNF
jgi:mobilome CxxCx(11)CxxC protein